MEIRAWGRRELPVGVCKLLLLYMEIDGCERLTAKSAVLSMVHPCENTEQRKREGKDTIHII